MGTLDPSKIVPSIQMQDGMTLDLHSVELNVVDRGQFGRSTTALVAFVLSGRSVLKDQKPDSIQLLETVKMEDEDDLNKAAESARRALANRLHDLAQSIHSNSN